MNELARRDPHSFARVSDSSHVANATDVAIVTEMAVGFSLSSREISQRTRRLRCDLFLLAGRGEKPTLRRYLALNISMACGSHIATCPVLLDQKAELVS